MYIITNKQAITLMTSPIFIQIYRTYAVNEVTH